MEYPSDSTRENIYLSSQLDGSGSDCMYLKCVIKWISTCLFMLFLLLLTSVPAVSQVAYTNATTPLVGETSTTSEPLDFENRFKGRALARSLAAGSTILGGVGLALLADDAVLVLPGLVFGPSVGSFYARDPLRGWRGIGIRSGLLLGGNTILVLIDDSVEDGALFVALSTSLGMLFSAAIDIFQSSATSVDEHNECVRARSDSARLSIAPWLSPSNVRPGVHLSLRF